jgi:hypothetical protein
MDAWIDLGGNVEWVPVREWSAHYGIALEWLLPVLRRAARMLEDHNEKLRKTKRAAIASRPVNRRN